MVHGGVSCHIVQCHVDRITREEEGFMKAETAMELFVLGAVAAIQLLTTGTKLKKRKTRGGRA